MVSTRGAKYFSCPKKNNIVSNAKECKHCGQKYHPPCYERCLEAKTFKCCDNGRNYMKDSTTTQGWYINIGISKKRDAKNAGIGEDENPDLSTDSKKKKQEDSDR